MSKFLVLLLVNLPIVVIGVLGAITSYKTSRISKKRSIIEVSVWLLVGLGLFFIQPAYNLLIEYELTDSEPMSLFDILLLTLVLLAALFIKNANEKISLLNRKISQIHEHIVIKESQYDEKL